jgi:para-nitrobenzyl esterase
MPSDPRVALDTPAGPVVGRRDGRVLRFGGVPYARAPRWGAPAPCSWSDPLDATAPGAAPPQTVSGLDLVPGMIPKTPQVEDCLTADVCTPALDGARPILMWVPGGSFLIGGASLPVYDGAHLAARDVVVISVNYRLGALGWLAADGVPSNLGLRDLRAAVDWVRANAPAFGGDPDRIVLMGESAGSGCIAHLLASDPSLPIAGAILQSGAPASTLDADKAALVGTRFLEAAGAASVDDLRDAPVDVLLAAQDAAVRGSRDVGAMPFHPWTDGELLHERAHAAKLPPAALVVGTTAHEMELFRDQMPQLTEELTIVAATRSAARLGITEEARVRAAVAACGGDFVTATSDLELNLPNELLARQHAARGNPVYRYRFTWEAPVLRACHALDLPFTFGTLDRDTWREFAGASDGHAAAADALSDRMQSAWTSFAATLVPSDAVVGDWPEDTTVLLGGDARKVDGDEVGDRVNIWLGEA